MEWFKHKTGSLDDPHFNAMIDEFGSDGYMMFFGLLEIYGSEYKDIDSDGFLHISFSFVARKLRKNRVKVEKFLNYCQEKNFKVPWEYSTNGTKLSYKVPKFIDLSSNWTKRIHDTPTEAPTEAPTAKRSKKRDIEEDTYYITKKGRKLKGKRLETFERFWLSFNYKKAKSAAADSWYDILTLTDALVEKIITAAKVEAKDRPGIIAQNKTPKFAQGWLTERRWEDEPYKNPEIEYEEVVI